MIALCAHLVGCACSVVCVCVCVWYAIRLVVWCVMGSVAKRTRSVVEGVIV